MKFYICRLSFVPSHQKALNKERLEKKPIFILEELFINNLEFHPKRYGMGLCSLEFGDLIRDNQNNLLAGKIGKKRGIKKVVYNAGRFNEEKDESHPYVNFLWDRSQQVMIIEKNSSVFPEIDRLVKSIESHFNNLMAKYEINVNIIPITKKIDFWNIFKEYDLIYEVKFELLMPNFLGRTNRSVKEFLEPFKADYNALDVEMGIKNIDGYLEIKENDESISKILDWIAKGGGTWSALAKKSRSNYGRKSTITSGGNIKFEEISTYLNLRSSEEIIKIIKRLAIIYEIKDDKK